MTRRQHRPLVRDLLVIAAFGIGALAGTTALVACQREGSLPRLHSCWRDQPPSRAKTERDGRPVRAWTSACVRDAAVLCF